MKQVLFSAASLLFLLSHVMPSSAQTTATWKGNKPGQPTAWDCAANWKEGRVPNEFCQVVIPAGASVFPVITDVVEPIDALLVESGASLTLLPTGRLTVANETGRFNGVLNLGTIHNKGLLEIKNRQSGSLAVAHK